LGATKYVRIDGNDASGDGSSEYPWATIQKAVNTADSGDTIKIGAGTYQETAYNYLLLDTTSTLIFESESGLNDVTVNTSHRNHVVYVYDAGTFTFNNMTFRPSGTVCSWMVLCDPNTAYDISFNNCILDMAGATGRILYTGTGAVGKKVKLNGCTIAADNVDVYGAFYVMDFEVVEITGCAISVTGNTNAPVVIATGRSGTLKVTNNSITDNTGVATVVTAATVKPQRLDYLIVNGNTVTGCSRFIYIVDQSIGFGEICDNDVTSNAEQSKFCIGLDSGTGINTLRGFVIKNNILTSTAASGHCILLGTNCQGTEVAHNTFISSDPDDYGIVIKGDYNHVHHNFVKSANCIYLFQAQYNKVEYNSCYGIGGLVCYWNENGGDAPQGNIITNNIFDASGGSLYALYDLNTGHHDNLVDYNCYWNDEGVVKLDGSVYSLIGTLQAKWAAWSGTWPGNDSHSMIAEPQYSDPNEGDFRLRSGSPCLNSGEPTPGGGYTSIGAWQGVARTVPLEANCGGYLEMDFNNDCRVDLEDFVLFGQSWLDCNLEPVEE